MAKNIYIISGLGVDERVFQKLDFSDYTTTYIKWILPVELITHALSAIGIYWGRFLRFNSWDFITQPDAIITKGVEEILGKQPLIIIAITFIILWGLYWFMKRITLAFVNKGVTSQNDHHIHNIS